MSDLKPEEPVLFADAPAPQELTTESSGSRHERPPRLTQLDRMKAMLVRTDAVCATTALEARMPRAAALIHMLKKQGWVIDSRRCRRPEHHHDTYQIEYFVVAMPEPGGQP